LRISSYLNKLASQEALTETVPEVVT
jgi:hypothetical protein